jgi:hypothetical protein
MNADHAIKSEEIGIRPLLVEELEAIAGARNPYNVYKPGFWEQVAKAASNGAHRGFEW